MEEERRKKQSSQGGNSKGSQPDLISDELNKIVKVSESGVMEEGRAKDVNDNFDYNNLKHTEVGPNQGTIDYLKPRDPVTSDEPEFVTLKDALPVADAQDPTLRSLTSYQGHGEMLEDVQEMKRLNNHMMSQCNKITRRCREERKRK